MLKYGGKTIKTEFMELRVKSQSSEEKTLLRGETTPEDPGIRKVTIYDSLGGSKDKTIQEMWDENGKQLWTYFNENIKQFIELYLSQKLKGRNLDVGGGWYLHYPNSDVVDISPVCLDYNLAPKERKHVFDLESISRGAKLPFDDHTFDSATAISVMQYLPEPWSIIKEIGRVLKPDSEFYVIGGQNSGVYDLVMSNGFRNTREIEDSFKSKDYDTVIERIPTPDGRVCEFDSVCVAMPDENGISKIKNKRKRLADVEKFNPQKFLDDYTDLEVSRQISKLSQIQRYPITKHSRELLEKISKFTKYFSDKTGNIPLLYCNAIQPEFDMALPGQEPIMDLSIVSRNGNGYESLSKEMNDFGFRFSHCFGFLPNTENEMNIALKNPDKSRKRQFTDFVASIKLNEPALELSDRIEKVLLRRDIGYLQGVYARRAGNLDMVSYQYKQRRRVDELIERKKFIESKPELIADHGEMKFEEYIPYLKNIIRPGALLVYTD
jgi:ubiquinone/menaquinone biosynthesis C-methylase UbiE